MGVIVVAFALPNGLREKYRISKSCRAKLAFVSFLRPRTRLTGGFTAMFRFNIGRPHKAGMQTGNFSKSVK